MYYHPPLQLIAHLRTRRDDGCRGRGATSCRAEMSRETPRRRTFVARRSRERAPPGPPTWSRAGRSTPPPSFLTRFDLEVVLHQLADELDAEHARRLAQLLARAQLGAHVTERDAPPVSVVVVVGHQAIAAARRLVGGAAGRRLAHRDDRGSLERRARRGSVVRRMDNDDDGGGGGGGDLAAFCAARSQRPSVFVAKVVPKKTEQQ